MYLVRHFCLMKESTFKKVDKVGVPKGERGSQGSQGRYKGLELSKGKKDKISFNFFIFFSDSTHFPKS